MLSGFQKAHPSSSSYRVQISFVSSTFLSVTVEYRETSPLLHFPSYFPSITLGKLKSQAGELLEKNALK